MPVAIFRTFLKSVGEPKSIESLLSTALDFAFPLVVDIAPNFYLVSLYQTVSASSDLLHK